MAAADFVDRLRRGNQISIIPQTPRQFDDAFKIFRERNDKAWSLTDCASLAIARDFGISEVLTHDVHFEQMGLRALLRS